MLLAFFPLMLKPLTGVAVHETLGVGFVVLTFIHVLNNKGWVKSILYQKDGSRKNTGTVIINLLLFVSLAITLISGIMVSVVLFGFLNIPYRESFYTIHTLSAQAVLLLSLVHLFMHMKMIKAFFRGRKQARSKRYE
jgi:hypothetical protein